MRPLYGLIKGHKAGASEMALEEAWGTQAVSLPIPTHHISFLNLVYSVFHCVFIHYSNQCLWSYLVNIFQISLGSKTFSLPTEYQTDVSCASSILLHPPHLWSQRTGVCRQQVKIWPLWIQAHGAALCETERKEIAIPFRVPCLINEHGGQAG